MEVKTIYKSCYECLWLIADSLDSKYAYGQKDEEMYEEFWQILTSPNKIYDKIILENVPDYISKDIRYLKRVMQLIVASKAYAINYYNIMRNISVETSREMLYELENVDYKDVIKAFLEKNNLCTIMIESFFEYFFQIYIGQEQSKAMIIKDKKVKYILKLNPFEVTDLGDYIPDKDFLTSELLIQFISDIGLKCGEYCEKDENGELESYENEDEFYASTFIEFLKKDFKENEKKIIIAIRYILANVYEILSVKKRKNQKEKSFLEYIESNSPIEAVNRFLDDYEFAIFVIDEFLDGNSYLMDGDIFDRRIIFNGIGNIEVLRNLNPCFEEETTILKRIKETSSN